MHKRCLASDITIVTNQRSDYETDKIISLNLSFILIQRFIIKFECNFPYADAMPFFLPPKQLIAIL